jgi:hypothetical protein
MHGKLNAKEIRNNEMKKANSTKIGIHTPIKATIIKATFLLSLCLGLSGPSGAATIVQEVGIHFAEHGAHYGNYQPFDPSLGPLDQVVIAITGTAQSGNFVFTNTSDSPVTFTGTIGLRFDADGQPINFASTFTETLPPVFPDDHVGVEGGFSVTHYYPPAGGTGKYPVIGNYPLGPDIYFPSGMLDYASVSDPRITVSVDPLEEERLDAVETVTYVYGVGATLLPEPPSLVLLGTAVVAVVGFTLRRRRA